MEHGHVLREHLLCIALRIDGDQKTLHASRVATSRSSACDMSASAVGQTSEQS
jgi:hypothetical protein